MSQIPETIVDPFDPAVIDETAELRALARSIELANGFKLILVRCNQIPDQHRLIAALREQLSAMTVREIQFDAPIEHLLDELRARFDEEKSDAILVTGLASSMPDPDTAHATPLVANLNAARNSFPVVVPCPLVLWLPEYGLTAISRGAPDFFSIRSGTYSFVARPDEIAVRTASATNGEYWQLGSLLAEEKRERISAVESLLDDYRSLPKESHEPRIEIKLLQRLAILRAGLGDYAAADKALRGCLRVAKDADDVEAVASCLQNLAILAQAQGDYGSAGEQYKDALSRFRELGKTAEIAACLQQLGRLQEDLGQFDIARDNYLEALQIAERLNDLSVIANCHNRLGFLALNRGDLDDASANYQKALWVFKVTHNHAGTASVYHQLGLLEQEKGAYDKASQWYESAQEINKLLGDRVGVASTKSQIGILRTEHGRPAEAVALNLESLAIRSDLNLPQMRIDLYWLARQRKLLGDEQFDQILSQHLDQNGKTKVLARLDECDLPAVPHS